MEFAGLLFPLCGAMLLLLLLAKLIAGNADRDRQARTTESGRIEFAPNRRSFWGVYLFIGCFGFVVVADLVHGITSVVDLAVPAACTGFVLLLLMAFPATIVADDKGIEQIYWMRSRKRIAWTELRKVDVDEKRGEVKISSKSGVRVVHGRQLPDRARLLRELDEHCTEKLVPAIQVPEASASDPAAKRALSA